MVGCFLTGSKYCVNGYVIARGDEGVQTFTKKTADFTVQKFDDYIVNIQTRNPAGNVNDPRRIYQERVAGLKEFEIKGSNNSKIWSIIARRANS